MKKIISLNINYYLTSDIKTKLQLEKDALNLIKYTLSKKAQKEIHLNEILKKIGKVIHSPNQQSKLKIIKVFAHIRNAIIEIIKMFNQDISECKIKQEKKQLRIKMQNFFMATHSLLKRNYAIDLHHLLKI